MINKVLKYSLTLLVTFSIKFLLYSFQPLAEFIELIYQLTYGSLILALGRVRSFGSPPSRLLQKVRRIVNNCAASLKVDHSDGDSLKSNHEAR